MTHLELFHGLVAAGMRMRYGDKPFRKAVLRVLWEKKHIIDAGFVDYYLMAFWTFIHYADSMGIGFWARGAVPSSIVCYCLRLTEVDPLKYGLHAARFVNDELPQFQFDIEASRFDEFKKGAEEMLQANAGDFDIPTIKACLLKEDVKLGEKMRRMYLTPCEYLSRKHERPLPEDIDDELTRYALRFPQTMDLYDYYIRRKTDGLWTRRGPRLDEILAPTLGILVYQEQMLEILRQFFHVSGIEANQIRRSIQIGEENQVKMYKRKLFANLQGLTDKKAERVWQILTSNPNAFLKAHAVSRVLAKYHYDF